MMSQTDLELLALAAKAAGDVSPLLEVWKGEYAHFEQRGVGWNPLTDDGQALRLAALLRLRVLPGKHLGDGCTVESKQEGIAGCTAFHDDPATQMRRAIVHVAAEIGKAMA